MWPTTEPCCRAAWSAITNAVAPRSSMPEHAFLRARAGIGWPRARARVPPRRRTRRSASGGSRARHRRVRAASAAPRRGGGTPCTRAARRCRSPLPRNAPAGGRRSLVYPRSPSAYSRRGDRRPAQKHGFDPRARELGEQLDRREVAPEREREPGPALPGRCVHGHSAQYLNRARARRARGPELTSSCRSCSSRSRNSRRSARPSVKCLPHAFAGRGARRG